MVVFKNIVRLISKLIAFFLHPILIKLFRLIINNITSEFISKQLKEYPVNLNVSFPIFSIGLENIKIGKNCTIGPRMRLDTYSSYLENNYTPEIELGNNIFINSDCHIGCINKIYIGNNVMIASKVFMSDHSHGSFDKNALNLVPVKRELISKGPIIIEDNVWIGEGVSILSNVRIGENSIIGANSVITKSIPENSVVAGNPAKIIKQI